MYLCFFIYVNLGEPLRGFHPLASGYPLHHLRALRSLRWFRFYPSRKNPFVAKKIFRCNETK